MKIPVCVIFDIGKTNKKLFVFNQRYQVLEEKIGQFDEISDGDGFHGENIESLSEWIKTAFSEILRADKYDVLAVNFSTYGASFVHLNQADKPVTPLYNYLKNFPNDLRVKFFQNIDSVEKFCTETASSDSGMLNSGLQLFWLKNTKPAIFKDVVTSLHFPQFCSFLFTQKKYSEKTSIGCHTALWDFQDEDYHAWVEKENLIDKLAPIVSTTHIETVKIGEKQVNFGVGIHDSSAALVPYIQAFKEPFVLLSTGTWCVSMNPSNNEPLTEAELLQDCLCYINYKGEAVKSARLFAGNEHERQVKHLAAYFEKDLDYYKNVQFDGKMVWNLRVKLKQSVPDSTQVGLLADCPFVERNLNQFKSYEEAYHQFMLDLIAQQTASLKLVFGKKKPKNIFVEGGFASNKIFMSLLSEVFSDIKVQSTSLGQASAIGAALVIKNAWGGQDFDKSMMGV